MRTSSRSAAAAASLIVAALMLVSACSSTAPAPAAPAPPEDKPVLSKPNPGDDLLFVARSKTAELTLDARGKGKLVMVSTPTMTWFTDRPRHDAGTMTSAGALEEFGWEKDGDSLGEQPPNAALTADNLPEAVVVELRSASRDADQVTFEVETVPQEGPEKDLGKDRGRTEVTLRGAALFIDSVDVPEEQISFDVHDANNIRGHIRVVRTEPEGTETATVTFYVASRGARPPWPGSPDIENKQYTFTLTAAKPLLEDLRFTIDENPVQSDQIDVVRIEFHPERPVGAQNRVEVYGTYRSGIYGGSFYGYSRR